MNAHTTRAGGMRGQISGRHVLVAVIAFFAVIFAVNGVFVYYALSTHTGLDNASPYRRGIDYNERLAAERRQQARGWTARLTLAPTSDHVELTLADNAGLPVPGLRVTATIGRPSTTRFDRALSLEAVDHGRYTATLAPLEPGGWVVDLEASERTGSGEAVVYRMKQRLWLKP